MPVFFVTFDLNHDEGYDHYPEFVAEIEKMRGHRIMNNACLVNVRTGSARAVLEHLKKFIEDTDRIFAARVETSNSYFLHAYPGTNEWIEHNPLDPKPVQPSEKAAETPRVS